MSERGNITTNITEIENIIREFGKYLQVNENEATPSHLMGCSKRCRKREIYKSEHLKRKQGLK